jgi:hypothetical protein
MFEEERIVKVYRVTVKKIIERLLELQEVNIKSFQDEVIEQFDGYDYKDIEELSGFDSWPELHQDGKYELSVKIDHEDAYEFTIYGIVEDGKISVVNVL